MIRVAIFLPLLVLAACKQEMNQQRKENTYARSELSKNGSAARMLPEGAVARGDLERDRIAANPPPITAELLERGRERYAIACVPCHGAAGDGDGMIVRRGFPPPPSYHTQRLRAVPARYFYDVITDGYGVMYSYAARVQPADRWAIAAYIRALQLSRHATLAEAPEAAGRLP
ncbi:c-type cytochrome [Roseomonas populi]|uniref:Cytochrome c n=1 Tax=Roseomonas populi TaxID=3121582 RepID=A0ABT1X4A9_9PROT|nr:cytochrome c [Roseomonas pecuniae]MCR0982928.1 cytochrome c [Roseomonas pecuniae]